MLPLWLSALLWWIVSTVVYGVMHEYADLGEASYFVATGISTVGFVAGWIQGRLGKADG